MHGIRPLALYFLILGCTPGLIVDPATAQEPPVQGIPLAFIGEDTLTTTHLKIELAIMRNRNTQNAPTVNLVPEHVLKRLIQNQLIVQEGYRLGMDQEFTVTNQVLEVVRHECMAALLDSVALSIPADTPDLYETRRLAVKSYLDGLQETYEAWFDSTLLKSLDYGVDDPEVQKYLQESEEILAVVPTGKLTVSAFSRVILFTEFHGLIGKPHAAQRRDEIFREWFAEALVNFQYQAQGMDKNPEVVMIAERMTRNLVLEETLNVLLDFDFSPTEEEVESFYRAHIDAVTPAPMVKMKSLKTATEEQALALYEKMLRGTPTSWLYSNDHTVVQGPPPFPEDFFKPEQLGLKPEVAVVDYIPPPYQVPSGWVVAVVSEVKTPPPAPLDSCRPKILTMMKGEQTQQLMVDILMRLEEASPVEILPGAEAAVAAVIEDFEAQGGAVLAEPVADPQGEE